MVVGRGAATRVMVVLRGGGGGAGHRLSWGCGFLGIINMTEPWRKSDLKKKKLRQGENLDELRGMQQNNPRWSH